MVRLLGYSRAERLLPRLGVVPVVYILADLAEQPAWRLLHLTRTHIVLGWSIHRVRYVCWSIHHIRHVRRFGGRVADPLYEAARTVHCRQCAGPDGGEWDVGHIHETRGGPDSLRWFWSLRSTLRWRAGVVSRHWKRPRPSFRRGTPGRLGRIWRCPTMKDAQPPPYHPAGLNLCSTRRARLRHAI
jgi:hypothetical protein